MNEESKTYRPAHTLLKPYIHCYWTLRGCASERPYLLPPVPYYDCILSFAEDTKAHYSNHLQSSVQGSFLGGIRTSPVLLAANGKIEYLAIQFYPHALRPFLDDDCEGFRDRFIPIASIPGAFSRCLRSISETEESMPQRIQRVEQSLVEILEQKNRSLSPHLDYAIHLMKQAIRIHPVEDLSFKVNLSTRQLQREFRRFVGIGPKKYARILRFYRFLMALQSYSSSFNLATLADRLGYYDQAHCIHECKELSGLSPSELMGLHLSSN